MDKDFLEKIIVKVAGHSCDVLFQPGVDMLGPWTRQAVYSVIATAIRLVVAAEMRNHPKNGETNRG